ncbi:hypothetical protein M422DRAFT_276433 [Sphaerobolus stellatus SS14]|uniref:Unplaced genomic scaffold SPHSTscaffold_745, whole genome shotgun sequence n=1 Tax=Sphaerobolus stellatus (strain SS14) TaxID=990650 RepID=A0A0C9TMJ6_SPHS4|nr:hypothetical protein M422DRAFT_276433 [Sphaerobolus stellatus SS14]
MDIVRNDSVFSNGVFHMQIYKYFTSAALALLIYSYLLTFEKEKIYVWKQAKTLPFYIFLILRYFPLVVFMLGINFRYTVYETPVPAGFSQDLEPSYGILLDRYNCGFSFFRLFLGPVVTATSTVILILRVNAIYNKVKWIMLFMIVMYLGQMAATMFSIYQDSQEFFIDGDGRPASLSNACPPIDELDGTNPNTLLPLVLSAISFDIVIFSLTIIKGIRAKAKGTSTTLLKVLVQGGNIYFMALFSVNSLNALLILLTMDSYLDHGREDSRLWIGSFVGNINVQFTAAITSVIVSYLFLDLREAACRSRRSYSSPSAITATARQWFQVQQCKTEWDSSSCTDIPAENNTKGKQFFGQKTFQDIMGYEDFAVDLQHFDDEDYDAMDEEDDFNLRKGDLEGGV